MLQDSNGAFINVAKLDLKKYAKRPALAKALFLYLLHVDEQPVKALELAARATEHQEYQDHWWKGKPAADSEDCCRLGIDSRLQLCSDSATIAWACFVTLRSSCNPP